MVDIRRTPEAQRRARSLGRLLDYAPPEVLADEIGLSVSGRDNIN